MKVKELIAELQKCQNQDAKVIIDMSHDLYSCFECFVESKDGDIVYICDDKYSGVTDLDKFKSLIDDVDHVISMPSYLVKDFMELVSIINHNRRLSAESVGKRYIEVSFCEALSIAIDECYSVYSLSNNKFDKESKQ